MKFRPDTTFPYVEIAHRYGVDYGEVIRFSDALKNYDPPATWTDALSDVAKLAVLEANRQEMRRREKQLEEMNCLIG